MQKSFEQFMKQDLLLQKFTSPYVFLFYNTLCHLCDQYGIPLKPLHELTRTEPISESGGHVSEAMDNKMSTSLFHKLQMTGCLSTDNTRIQNLLLSHGMNYDGFDLLKHILRPFVPTIQDGTRQKQPTWESSEKQDGSFYENR